MFDFTGMTAEQLLARSEELRARSEAIAAEIRADGADVKALSAEADGNVAERQAISDELEARRAAAQQAAEQRAADFKGGTKKIEKKGSPKMEEKNYDFTSPEYRSAWLKNLAVTQDGVHLFGEMNEEERAAFTHTTANSGNVVPQVIMNEIIELLDNRAPMYQDAYHTNMTQGFGVPRRKAINAGDAAGVAEGAANADDEENDFDLLPLDGVEIKKHVVLSRKMKFKSIDAFETWLVKELGDRIVVAKERLCIARAKGSAPEGGSAVADAAIAVANRNASVARTDAGIRGMLALVKGASKTIYANSNTIWNILAGIEDGGGHRLFITSGQVDPTVAGVVYGAKVKEDPQLADDEFFIFAKGMLQVNDYDDLYIFSTVEAKTANEVKTAYALTDAGVRDPKGGAYGKFVAAS